MLHLTPTLVLVVLLLYFAMLVGVAWYTGRGVSNSGFFLANRKVPWYVVAYAMIGTSISGVTFISIPGAVGGTGLNMAFSYMQVVFGYLLGYLFIATVLMPLYYRLNLTSIYGYLEQRFGWWSYKTGAGFFLLSRTVGSAARMFLAASVLQTFVFAPLGVPFAVTVILMLALIYGYTYKGGLKTIIWTDTIMTTFFLAALVFTVFTIGKALNLGGGDLFSVVVGGRYGKMFFFENFLTDPNHFVKQFVSGALIAIAMTGLDQDLMQKNLACKNIREAQKNMLLFCVNLVIINFLFLTLGALLYLYAGSIGLEIPARTDHLYPKIAFDHLDAVAGIFFILGLVGSTYASSDSALTALTTSFCVDFLNFEKQENPSTHFAYEEERAAYLQQVEQQQRKTRTLVHLGFSAAFVVIILILNAVSSSAVISLLFKIAGYTYGPLLGLFTFGLFTRRQVKDRWVLYICLAAPFITYLIEMSSKNWFDVGFLTILINGALTFGGLWSISHQQEAYIDESDPSIL
ncbi:MAG: sodium:solute symporter [Saprospiraceae bacterium]|nr:sodium:solute symporter [Saprospiraceae bacterium]